MPLPLTRRELVALVGTTALTGRSGLNTLVQRESAPESKGQQVATQQAETVRAFIGSYHWGYVILDESGEERSQLTLSSGDELRLTLFNVEAEAAVDKLPEAVRAGIPSSDERAQRNEQALPVPQGTTLETLHDSAEAAYPDHGLAILHDDFLGARPGGSGQGPGGSGQGPGGPGQGPGMGPGGPRQEPGSGEPEWGPWGGHHGPHGGPSGPGGGQGGPYGPGSPGSSWGGYSGTLAPPVYLWHHSTVPNELGFVVTTSGSFGFACPVYCGYGHPFMVERGRIVVTEDEE
ncbi:hypothetical protein [Salinibaculum salinum]|uniref:hypothetical protein n=1 Tax=Salinibaculum salinum TaxID=3131996 RepID=UPI0030ECA141